MDRREIRFRGVGASPGIARGRLFCFMLPPPDVAARKVTDVDKEIGRFNAGLERTAQQLAEMGERISRELSPTIGQFLEIQVMILEDRELKTEVENFIKVYQTNSEYAFNEIMKRHSEKLLASKSKYFQDRTIDLWDLTHRVIRNLAGIKHTSVIDAPKRTIIAAHDLPPSEAALLNPEMVVGLACERGGETSHTAIMAKAFGIPAVLGVEGLMKRIQDNLPGIIDGYKGVVIVNPRPKTVSLYNHWIREIQSYEKRLDEFRGLQPFTKDGRHIELSANIELPAEVIAAVGEHISLVITDPPQCGRAPSTVVDISGGDVRILREGAIPWAQILEVVREAG